MYRTFVLGLLGLAALTGCKGEDDGDRFTGAAAEVPEEERYGGTAVVGNIGDIPSMNPLTSTDYAASQIQRFLLYTPLVTYDADFEAVPRLARSWELNEDTTAITFHLRDDVYWHDGELTTAYDLEYTYRMATTPETAYPNTAFFTYYGEAEAVDSFTFRVEMEPHAQYMDTWWNLMPVPRHILQGTEPARMAAHPYGTRSPVGNGPFRFHSRTDGQSWTFAANEDYPEELGGRPYLDRLVYRIIPETTTLLTELLTGRIDYYQNMIPQHAAEVERSDRARLQTYLDRNFVFVGWNHRREPFDDVRVRRALTMALDREEIVEVVLSGYGVVANHSVPPIFWMFDEEAGEDLEYDPERAIELLAEAGWTRDAGGVMRDEAGEPLQFRLLTNEGNDVRADAAQIAQAHWRRIGIQMEPRIEEWRTLISRITDVEERDFDAFLIGWVTEFRLDDRDLFHCDKIDTPYQWAGYCDPEADRLMDTLQVIVDREDARPYWERYQRKIVEDQPYTFIFFEERRPGISNRLQNIELDARGEWLGAAEWFILPEHRRGQADREVE